MKIYEKIKKYIKEYYKTIILYIIIIAVFTVKIPYYIESPGGLLDTSEKIITKENFKLKGSLNMAYVSELPATIPTYLWSKISKDSDAEIEEKIKIGKERSEDLDYRGKLLLNESNKLAVINAYNNSNLEYEIVNNKIYVTYVDINSKTNLKVRDQIIEVDGIKLVDKNHLMSYIKSKNINDTLKITVIRKNKKIKREAKLIKIDGEPKVGILVTEDFDIKSNNNIKFNFKKSETGPSGGLMVSLAIYSYLNKIDLTHGKIIAGTGTIEKDGTVGEISGVKYKLIGAVKKKAKVFLVPKGDNYKEAKKIKKERNYDIEIIPVETFTEAIKKLK